MAKHRKHRRKHGRRHGRRRHLGGFASFAGIESTLKHSAQLSSPLAGAAAGLAVTAGLKVLISNVQSLKDAIPDFIQNNMVLVGSLLGGVGLYLARRKKNRSAALGNLVGAVAAGGVAWTWDQLVSMAPATFGEVVTLNLSNGAVKKFSRGMNGLLVPETPPAFPPRGMAGMLVNDPSSGYSGLIQADNPARQGLQTYPGFGDGGTALDDDAFEDPTEGFAT